MFDHLTRRSVFILTISGLLTLGAVWLWAHEGHQALPTRGASVDLEKGLVFLSPEAREALGIATADAKLESFADRFTAPAGIEATWRGHAFASTRLAGKITALHVQPGQEVVAGQPLADVQSLELENLQLEWATALNESRLSAANLKSKEDSAREGASSEQDVFEERIRHQERLNTVELTRQKLIALGVQPDLPSQTATLSIRSPIAGIVIHADVRLGQVVEPQQHLFEIVDPSTVRMRADVLESDLPQVGPDLPFELRLTGSSTERFNGTIQGTGLTLDPKTRLAEVWADLRNPSVASARLLPGVVGQLEFRRPREGNVLSVPASALASQGAENHVFLAEGPGQYARKNVVILQRFPDRVLLGRGVLEPGDPVVTAGSHELESLFDQHDLRLSAEAARGVGLRVEPAQRRTVAEIISLECEIDLPPDKRAAAAARLPGVIQAIRKERDQTVKAGDIIAEVASLEAQSLELELLRSHLQLQILRQTLDRLRPLIESRNPAVSTRQMRESQSAVAVEANRGDSLRRRLVQAGLSDEQLKRITEERRFVETIPVRAPIGGALVRFHAALGQVVKAEDPLFEIQDLSGIWVQGRVLESDYSRIRTGQSGRITIPSNPTFTADGTVRRLARVFDPEDRTAAVWVEMPAEKTRHLPVGMLARLALVVAEPLPTLAVPKSAVAREAGQSYVFVRRGDGTFERRIVTVGRQDDRFIEITSGLSEGESVAVSGVAALQTAYASVQ